MSLLNRILENSFIYACWSKTFISRKLEAIAKVLPEIKGRKILDIACGPASNTHFFESNDYTGIDINPCYIQTAQKKYPHKVFMVQDACSLSFTGSFDIILINSLLHHLSDQAAHALFSSLKDILNSDGKIIILEPLIPQKMEYVKLLMMKLDRGKFFRSHGQYEELFDSAFKNKKHIIFDLKFIGIPSWTTIVMRLERA